MHRIDTPTAQKDKFGQGKNGFTNGDPTTGTPSTKLNSDIYDALQEEVCTVIESAGIRLNKSQHDQLYQSVKKLSEAEANKAKLALVDGATVDLNTLNKLAKALGNDAKFSETVTNLLNQKLAKNENGADIPDTNQFVKNLGLTETIYLAKNATPSQRKINGKTLVQDVQLTATDVHAVSPEILRVEIPVGVPLPWPTETAPTGWFICNGEPFDKKKYPLLALAYPSGKLPDLRGEFIRGWDAGRKVDNGRKILSAQSDAMQKIWAEWTMDDQAVSSNFPPKGAFYCDNKDSVNYDAGSRNDWWRGYQGHFDSSRVTRTAEETRPRNVAFNYIVRAA